MLDVIPATGKQQWTRGTEILALRELIFCIVHDCHCYVSFFYIFCYKSWQIRIMMMMTLMRVFILLSIYCVAAIMLSCLRTNYVVTTHKEVIMMLIVWMRKLRLGLISPKSEIKKNVGGKIWFWHFLSSNPWPLHYTSSLRCPKGCREGKKLPLPSPI